MDSLQKHFIEPLCIIYIHECNSHYGSKSSIIYL